MFIIWDELAALGTTAADNVHSESRYCEALKEVTLTTLFIEISLTVYGNIATFDLIISFFGKEVGITAFSPSQAVALAHVNLDSLHNTVTVL